MINSWKSRRIGKYVYYEPLEGIRHRQGWKLHISFLPRDYEWVLREVTQACVARTIPFKIVADRELAFQKIAKGESRLTAGKSCAIYAGSEDTCRELIDELEDRLAGLDGPEILTSLRVSETVPLFARYGAFLEMYTADEHGFQIHAFELMDGRRVPDHRSVRPSLPDGVKPAEFYTAALQSRKDRGTEIGAAGLTVDKVLQYSTGGGVYLGVHDGATVVVKEGRPLIGLDVMLRDAVDRLRDEYAAHRALQHLEGVPRAHGLFRGRRHLFLVREYVPGSTVLRARDDMRVALDETTFQLWCDEVEKSAHAILERIWDEGWAVNDVQPANFIFSDDAGLSLIDLECVRRLDDGNSNALIATRTFTPDPEATGKDKDLGGLAAMRLWLALGFVPPVTGPAMRFLGDVAGDVISVSEGLQRSFDLLQEIGDRRDRRDGGSDDRAGLVSVANADEVLRTAEAARAESEEEELQGFASRTLAAGIPEAFNGEDPELTFWDGVTGARAVLGASEGDVIGESPALFSERERPWESAGWEEYLAAGDDSRMLNGLATSSAFAAALMGAPFDVDGWATAVTQRLSKEEFNRSLRSGLAGPLVVCNKVGRQGGAPVENLVEQLVETMLRLEHGDRDASLLGGRAGAAISLIAADDIFETGTRQEGLALLRSSAERIVADPKSAHRGGLTGFVGTMALLRAVARDDDEFAQLGGRLPEPSAWGTLRHHAIGLAGTGGTFIAADTLVGNASWARLSAETESWQRCACLYSGDAPFSRSADTRASYSLYSGLAGLVAGLSLGGSFWKEWFSIGA
ncbi:Lanthionine biosynthesis protein LanL [Micrococcus lylae]|uniref:Lanthionine biosynthesis protein LanL n=1 Tax=Micrococcus lylae TaxID=1273 RepID=A0A1R4IZL8_9MICC|nr:protein kinase family protein [Micrococcus lylae]SJN25320.1 Lanthionine biosynthesis protein LanL [Micrococcus lylae]